MGWGSMNLTASLGAVVIVISVLLFIINVLRSLRGGELAPADPWGAGTLEWSTTSPPPAGNFELIPVVHGRDPLWEAQATPSHVTGLSSQHREVLITSVNDAELDHRLWMPSSTIWPFLAAVATTVLFVGSIFTPWAIVWGAVPVAIAATLWFWPTRKTAEQRRATEVLP
jgi:cytochrome c oxidase subunit 1